MFSDRQPIGPSGPNAEVAALSAYIEWLIEAGHNIDNPCRGYKSRIRVDKKASRPQHVAVIPTDTERETVFDVNPEPPAHLKTKGRAAWHKRWTRNRAVWKLSYYLAGPRPESELCPLRWRDVVFPEDSRARFGGGQVTLSGDKTGPRTVPLHAEAEAALRSIMPANPDPNAYLFSKRGKPDKPWDRNSYRKAWAATLAEVSKAHPRLAGMWVRDFRKAAITDMRAAGTDRAIAAKTAGHSAQMSDDYTQAPDQHAQAAVARLGRKKTGGRVLGCVLAADSGTTSTDERATVN